MTQPHSQAGAGPLACRALSLDPLSSNLRFPKPPLGLSGQCPGKLGQQGPTLPTVASSAPRASLHCNTKQRCNTMAPSPKPTSCLTPHFPNPSNFKTERPKAPAWHAGAPRPRGRPHPITLQVPVIPRSTFEYPGHRRHVNAATCHPHLQQPATAARWHLTQRARRQRSARAGTPAKLSMRASRPWQACWRSFARAGVPAELCPCRYAAQAQEAIRLSAKKRARKVKSNLVELCQPASAQWAGKAPGCCSPSAGAPCCALAIPAAACCVPQRSLSGEGFYHTRKPAEARLQANRVKQSMSGFQQHQCLKCAHSGKRTAGAPQATAG